VCAVGLVVVLVLDLHPVWAVIAADAAGYLLCKSGDPFDHMEETDGR